MAYEIDGDALYTSDEEASDSSPVPSHRPQSGIPRSAAATAQPPPLNPTYRSFSSSGPLWGGTIAAPIHPPRINAVNHVPRINPPNRPPRNTSTMRAPTLHAPTIHPQLLNAPRRIPQAQAQAPPPSRGRGRALTLPAHVTQCTKPAGSNEVIPPARQALSGAASILPESERARFVSEELRRRNARASIRARKRPGRRTGDVARRAAAAREGGGGGIGKNGKKSGQGVGFQGLNSLLKTAQLSSSLITLDPERGGGGGRVRESVCEKSVYEGVTTTKVMVEREMREKERMERERVLEMERLDAQFRELRHLQAVRRRELKRLWQLEETVAAGVRDSYVLARTERDLFAGEHGKRKDCLSFVGLSLKKLTSDDFVDRLFTIEVVDI